MSLPVIQWILICKINSFTNFNYIHDRVFKKCEVEANEIKLNAADKNWRYKKVNLAVETQFHRTSLSRSVALIRKMHLLITAAIHARKYTDNKRMYKKPQEFGTCAAVSIQKLTFWIINLWT